MTIKKTSEKMRADFEKDGFVTLPGLLSSEEVALVSAKMNTAVASSAEPLQYDKVDAVAYRATPSQYRAANNTILKRLDRIIDRGGIFQTVPTGGLRDAAEQVAGEAVQVLLNRHNMAMIKAPLNPSPVPWHQDAPIWDDGVFSHLSAIVAIDDFLPDNGCLQVVPGTQHLPPESAEWERHTFSIAEKYAGEIANAVSVPLRAGDGLLFHSMLLHGSPGNNSTRTRRSLTFAYFPGDLRKLSRSDHPRPLEILEESNVDL